MQYIKIPLSILIKDIPEKNYFSHIFPINDHQQLLSIFLNFEGSAV